MHVLAPWLTMKPRPTDGVSRLSVESLATMTASIIARHSGVSWFRNADIRNNASKKSLHDLLESPYPRSPNSNSNSLALLRAMQSSTCFLSHVRSSLQDQSHDARLDSPDAFTTLLGRASLPRENRTRHRTAGRGHRVSVADV